MHLDNYKYTDIFIKISREDIYVLIYIICFRIEVVSSLRTGGFVYTHFGQLF